jgi:hypothetical protein
MCVLTYSFLASVELVRDSLVVFIEFAIYIER